MGIVPALNRLTTLKAKNAQPGKYADGGGLWLIKRVDGGAQWVLRITIGGRRREMGLGRAKLKSSETGLSLVEAREEAERWRRVVGRGDDPIKVRERLRRDAARQGDLLAEVAVDAFEARKADLKADGAAGRWFSPLELHILPKLGKVPVNEIDQAGIRDALAPIWHAKAGTAKKALNRLGIVLRHAAALGFEVDLQATEKARALLGQQRHRVRNIPAMPWQDMPAFYASLAEPTITHLALRLLILTALRSAPVRSIQLGQISGNCLTIPASQMKGRVGQTDDFRVPLSAEAMAVVEAARPHARDGNLFPNVRQGVISDATMSRLMERRGMSERPHGFRSSFRDWCEVAGGIAFEVAETALGHKVGGAVVNAYRRTDYFEQRLQVMERWGNVVAGRDGAVVKLVGGTT